MKKWEWYPFVPMYEYMYNALRCFNFFGAIHSGNTYKFSSDSRDVFCNDFGVKIKDVKNANLCLI